MGSLLGVITYFFAATHAKKIGEDGLLLRHWAKRVCERGCMEIEIEMPLCFYPCARSSPKKRDIFCA